MTREKNNKRHSLSVDVEENVIGPLLQSAGFQKRGSIWNRILPKLTHVVQLQRSRTSTAKQVDITLNVGVWNRQVWTICKGKTPPEFIDEVECFPRFRVGKIIGAFRDRSIDVWWTLLFDSEMTATHTEIQDAIRTHVLPFLDNFTSLTDVKRFCDTTPFLMLPADRLYLAILSFIEGDKSQSESILNSFRDQRLEAWAPRVNEIRERLASL